ncbi:MAG: response regulator transcription factor [Anaerolineales bacterium]|nr:response regulator transcription factor [Anaerolineales bacterium]
MTKAKILLIESSRASTSSFAAALERKGFSVQIFNKMKNALAAASKGQPDVLILDAASMRTTGTRLCKRARDKLDGLPIILISPAGTEPDDSCGASQTLVHPFTPRKLINRVDRLIPGEEHQIMHVGPIKLDKAKNRVYTKSGQSRLTPKLVKLLEIFLNNPGRLMMRKTLIRKVWHTDYTGDTRTLDVHMSWLRQAIEEDPSSPAMLKTIRGMGYRLDLPE